MTRSPLELGAVLLVNFPFHTPQGHEQEGLRPAILVGLPATAGPPRYPVLFMTPLTTYRQQNWAAQAPNLYPVLSAKTGGLTVDSVALIDQTRALDATRARALLGQLSPQNYVPIVHALRLTFGLA